MNAEFAGGDNMRLTITGNEVAAAGNLATAVVNVKDAIRLADSIHKTAELMRRMAALVKAEKAAGEVA